MKTHTIYSSGASWSVTLEVHEPAAARWNDVPGIYCFSKLNLLTGAHTLLYVGQASSFKKRFVDHERWDEARLYGANRILAKVVPNPTARELYEKALIHELDPRMNVHHRPNQAAGMGAHGQGIISLAMGRIPPVQHNVYASGLLSLNRLL